jgi:hypothetical protein
MSLRNNKMDIHVDGLMQIMLQKRNSYAAFDRIDNCAEIEQNFMESICERYFNQVSADLKPADGYLVLTKYKGVIVFEYKPFGTDEPLNGDPDYLDDVFDIPMLEAVDMPEYTKSEVLANVLLGCTEDGTKVFLDVNCTMFENICYPDHKLYLINTDVYKSLCKEHNIVSAITVDYPGL